jgi:hypothetical protein
MQLDGMEHVMTEHVVAGGSGHKMARCIEGASRDNQLTSLHISTCICVQLRIWVRMFVDHFVLFVCLFVDFLDLFIDHHFIILYVAKLITEQVSRTYGCTPLAVQASGTLAPER